MGWIFLGPMICILERNKKNSEMKRAIFLFRRKQRGSVESRFVWVKQLFSKLEPEFLYQLSAGLHQIDWLGNILCLSLFLVSKSSVLTQRAKYTGFWECTTKNWKWKTLCQILTATIPASDSSYGTDMARETTSVSLKPRAIQVRKRDWLCRGSGPKSTIEHSELWFLALPLAWQTLGS